MRTMEHVVVDINSLAGEKNPRNPERGMNRYQLIEMIARLAEEKNMHKHKLTTNHFEAIKILWEKNL